MANFWDGDAVAGRQASTGNFWDADPTTEKPSVLTDVAKAAPTGLAKGIIGLAGLPGDAQDIAQKFSPSDWISQKFEEKLPSIAQFLRTETEKTKQSPFAQGLAESSGDVAGAQLPRSSDIQKAIESQTGEFYKPKTVAGEYAQTAGEFAPGVIGGGEGLLSKAFTRVAAPAIASETAGQLTKGTDAEPYARVAGAVAGGGLASALRQSPEVAAPTVDELKGAARAQYNHPDVKNVRIDPQATDFLHHWIRNDLENGANAGFRELNEPKTFAAISELSNRGGSMGRSVGAPVSIDDVSSVRKVLGRIADTKDATGNLTSDAVAANRAIDHVNSFLENLRQPDLVAGNANRASEILRDAGQNWGAAKRAEAVATKAENARIQAASTYGGGNINNATRQALRPLVKDNFRKAQGFNDAEREALSNAVEGNWAGNTARQVGKYGPDTGLKGLHHIGAAFGSGGASVPFSLAALGAKIIGDRSTSRAVERLDTMLRERSPLHRQNVASQNSPMIPSQATPGVMLQNPNYVAPLTARSTGQNALVNALLAAGPAQMNSAP